MKKSKLIFAIFFTLVIVGGLAGCGKQAAEDGTKTDETKSSVESGKLDKVPDEFYFVYDIDSYLDSFSDEYWADTEEWFDLYDNKEAYSKKWGEVMGWYLEGKLCSKTAGFSEIIAVDHEDFKQPDNYVKLSIADNKFLTTNSMSVLKCKPSMGTSEISLYVLGSDLYFYEMWLEIEEMPDDINLEKGKWTICQNEIEGSVYIETLCYIPLNEDYCLQLQYASIAALDEDKLTDMDEDTKNAYKENSPWSVEDLKELAEKTTELITIEEITEAVDEEEVSASLRPNTEDIALDDNTTVLMGSASLYTWGGTDAENSEGYINTVIAKNKLHEHIYLTEYSDDMETLIETAHSSNSFKEYTYKDREIWIEYYNDSAGDELEGQYIGIRFTCDGVVYGLGTLDLFDPSSGNVDEWIEGMAQEIVEFR